MNLTKPIIWLVVLIALLIGIFAVAGNYAGRNLTPSAVSQNSGQPVDQSGVRIPPAQPRERPQDVVAAQNPHGFQLLVSYVNTGFEPASASVKAGDTVRFTNNSTGPLWVAASGKNLYPGVQNGCGSSALDTCRTLAPGEYWEFTFKEKGTWGFSNNVDKSKEGKIVVN